MAAEPPGEPKDRASVSSFDRKDRGERNGLIWRA